MGPVSRRYSAGREDRRQIRYGRAGRDLHGNRHGGGAGYVHRTRQHMHGGAVRGGLEQAARAPACRPWE